MGFFSSLFGGTSSEAKSSAAISKYEAPHSFRMPCTATEALQVLLSQEDIKPIAAAGVQVSPPLQKAVYLSRADDSGFTITCSN